MQFENDIPLSVAIAAHSGTSFVPEKRGKQRQAEYAATMMADYEKLKRYADNPEKLKTLEEEFERYRAGYRKRTLAYLHSSSRLVSTMIAGPSNFPAARMNKRGDVAHKRLNELCEYRERALRAIMKKLSPELRPIMSGDSDAITRLEEKISKAERTQAAMKAANAIVRKKPKNEPTPEKIAELMESLGCTESTANKLFVPDFCGRYGFADYELTNNNANIRRMKERLESITRNQATPESSTKGENATIEDSPADNRVRLFFPGKPDEGIRSKLKSNGFRWTPSLGCWQAYRNGNSITVAKTIAGVGI